MCVEIVFCTQSGIGGKTQHGFHRWIHRHAYIHEAIKPADKIIRHAQHDESGTVEALDRHKTVDAANESKVTVFGQAFASHDVDADIRSILVGIMDHGTEADIRRKAVLEAFIIRMASLCVGRHGYEGQQEKSQ